MRGIYDHKPLAGTKSATEEKLVRLLFFLLSQEYAGAFPIPQNAEGAQQGNFGL